MSAVVVCNNKFVSFQYASFTLVDEVFLFSTAPQSQISEKDTRNHFVGCC